MTSIERVAVPGFGRWTVAGLLFINGFVVGSWAPQIPDFVSRLGIDKATLGLLIFCFGLGALCAMTIAGQLIAELGPRRVLRLFCVPVIMVFPIVARTFDVWTAAIVLALVGGAIGGMDLAMNANVVAIERRQGRAIMSSSHGFWSLGGFAAAGLGGIAIQAFGPLEHAIAVAVLLAIAWHRPRIISPKKMSNRKRIAAISSVSLTGRPSISSVRWRFCASARKAPLSTVPLFTCKKS